MHATSSIIYNPPTPKYLPPYKSPSLPPSHIRHQKLHSQRKSLRMFKIFPYCRRLPSTNVACARFRRARKVGSQLNMVAPTPIALAAQLVALKDLLTAARTVQLAQMDLVQSRLRALVKSLEAVQPVLVTNPLHLLPSTFRVSTPIPHSLAPDKS